MTYCTEVTIHWCLVTVRGLNKSPFKVRVHLFQTPSDLHRIVLSHLIGGTIFNAEVGQIWMQENTREYGVKS